jgi:hypothetical protein
MLEIRMTPETFAAVQDALDDAATSLRHAVKLLSDITIYLDTPEANGFERIGHCLEHQAEVCEKVVPFLKGQGI